MKRKLLLLLIVLILLTGCWDRRDIESRGFILGVAVDAYPPDPKGLGEKGGPQEASYEEEKKLEIMQLQTGQPAYAMTIQLPIIKKAALTSPQGSGGGGGSSQGGNTWEITQIGNSFLSMTREMGARTEFIPYYGHLQVIVISEKVARQGIEKVLDFFLRDPEMRRRVKVFISKGEAKSILDVTPRIEDYSSVYLAKLPRNSSQNSRMVTKTDLGEATNNIHSGHDFLLPRVDSTKDEIKTTGAAIFKGDKMVGWLSEVELEGTKFIRDFYEGGVILTKASEKQNGIIVLKVTKSKTKITPIIQGDNVLFQINIKVNGSLGEEINMHNHGQIDPALLHKAEKSLAGEIEKMCNQTIQTVQQKYKTDIFHFDHLLETEKPAYWKKVGPTKWNSLFPKVKTQVKADVNISLIGNVK